MEENSKSLYIKRTQRDYPMSFKLAVVREVESGAITNTGAMLKYGIQGHGTIVEWRRKFGNFEVGNTVTTNFRRDHNKRLQNWSRKFAYESAKTPFCNKSWKMQPTKLAYSIK